MAIHPFSAIFLRGLQKHFVSLPFVSVNRGYIYFYAVNLISGYDQVFRDQYGYNGSVVKVVNQCWWIQSIYKGSEKSYYYCETDSFIR